MSKKPELVTTAKAPYKCHVNDDSAGNSPDFIYGGPFFVPLKKEDRLFDLNTPTNVAHSGSFKRYGGPHLKLYKLSRLLKIVLFCN